MAQTQIMEKTLSISTSKKLQLIFLLQSLFLWNSGYAQLPLVGQKAPVIIFSAALDKKISTDYLNNKVVILDFWTTWCGPCIASFPTINKLTEKYKTNPSVVFACITYEPKSKVETFFTKRKKTLTALKLIDKDSITNKNYGVTSFPQTFIIDAKGIIRWSGNFESLATEMIDTIMATEYSRKSVPASVTPVTASPDIVKQFFTNLDSLNKEPGMLLFTKKSVPTELSTLRFDPGKVSGKFTINALGIELLSVISFTTSAIREAKMNIVNREKGDFYVDVLFQTETAYMKDKEFDPFENLYFQNSRELNFILYSLSKRYNFSCGFKKVLFDTYELKVADSVLMKNYFTINPNGSSRSDIKKNILEVSNYDFRLICKELRNRDIIVSGMNDISQRLDMTLDMNTIAALKKSFQEQGFALSNNGKVVLNVFEIVFN